MIYSSWEMYFFCVCFSRLTLTLPWSNSRSSRPEVLSRKSCSENMQQIARSTPMSKSDFNKAALQLYWNRTLAGVFSCKFAAYFQNTFFLRAPLDGCLAASVNLSWCNLARYFTSRNLLSWLLMFYSLLFLNVSVPS